MVKRKGIVDGDIQFLSELPLEECIYRLQSLEDDTFAVEFGTRSADAVEFHTQLLDRGIVRAEGQGSLRRWEGTLTRVDCQVQVREGIMRWLLLLGTTLFMLLMLVPTIVLLSAQSASVIWVGISVLFLLTLAGIMMLVQHYAPIDDTPDNLLAMITDCLKQ